MRFQPNPGFKTEMLRDPELRAHVHKKAVEVRDKAERNLPKGAPWMPRMDNPGRTFVTEETDEGERVINTEHGGHLYEYGSKNNLVFAPLRRAVRAAGLRLRELGPNSE